MKLVQRRIAAAVAGACAAAVLVLGVSGPAAWSAGLGASGGAAGAALPGHVVLPQAAPQLPAGSTTLGAAPAGQVLDLDVVLAGQDPDGLAQAVAAVSTPGSPDYRHYLSAAQYAAQYGPSAAEVAQVSSALRGEGLTVGAPEPGSTLLPVSGTASVVSAALGTPLESVQAPGDASRAIVNTASPQIPSSLDGVVTGVVGLNGLVKEQAMIKQGHPGSTGPGSCGLDGLDGLDRTRPFGVPRGPAAGTRPGSGRPDPRRRRPRRHPAGLRRRPGHSLRWDLHLDSALLHLRPRPSPGAGPYRDRAVHRHRGVRAVRRQRLRRLPGLLRAVQPHPQRVDRRWPRRPVPGRLGRGRARYRGRRRQRPLRLPRRLRGTQR